MTKRILFVAGVCISVMGIGLLSHFWMNNEDIESQAKRCDEVLQAYTSLGKFNGTALIAKDGEVILRKGYGVRNAALDDPHDAESIFRIYSITKPFTSTVVLRLVEQGKLSLDDKVSKFYPSLPAADQITIQHLLTHTSGLYEFTREGDFENTQANLLQLLKNRPADFPPGGGWSYCNSGYCLLGHIIAKVNKTTYERAVASHIFEPLGMVNSGFEFNTLEDARKAVGYGKFSDAEKTEVTMDDKRGPFAAGAIYSTVDDLWLFQQALNQGKLLGSDMLKKAWTGCPQNEGYGYGWQIGSRWFMRTVISHSGGASGFRSNLAQIRSGEYSVILLNNHENANVEFLTGQLFDVLDGSEVAIPTEKLKLAAAELESYVGFFQPENQHGVIRTYVVDGRLAVEFLGRAEGTMLAQGEDRFLQVEAGVEVHFLRDNSGQCTGLVANQDRMTINARKYEGAWGIPDSTEQILTDFLQSAPETSGPWHEAAFKLAHLYAYNDNQDAYKELCRRILDNHGKTQSARIAERTTKACLVSPLTQVVDEVGQLADLAYSRREDAGTFQWGGSVHWRDYLAVAKGMADYRRGNYPSAIETLESATVFSRHDQHSACVCNLLLAMSYHLAEQPVLAKERWASATAAIEHLPATYADGNWNDRILIDLLHREAETILGLATEGP